MPAQGHYADCLRLAERLKREGKLVARMKAADAADILWAQTSFGAYESLVVERGWSLSRWVRWQRRTLRSLLFAEPDGS